MISCGHDLCVEIIKHFLEDHDHTKYQRDALNIIYSSNILLYIVENHEVYSPLHVSSIKYSSSGGTVVCEQHMVPSLSIES